MLSTAPARNTSAIATTSKWSAYAATWCGIHCALTPILIVFMPALALSEAVERGFWAVAMLIGAVVFLGGPTRGMLREVGIFTAGAALWGASLAGLLEPIPETWTSATGALVVAFALYRSAKICREGACEVCEDDLASDTP
ncbi:MAG: MerC domain-containing protein [Gemmatimonadota bacterium]